MLLDMIKPIKYLGQNFLTSKKIAEDIVNAADVGPNDVVLEAGPGKGILTELLLKKAKKVIAVEKDERLARFLETKFSDRIKVSALSVIHGDILRFDLSDPRLTSPLSRGRNKEEVYKIVANIPYYITSRFLRKFLSANPPSGGQPSLMVLMVQKEVAERIIGKMNNGRRGKSRSFKTDAEGNFSGTRFSHLAKESILSISVKAYGKPEIVKKVPAGCFHPKPKVDSAIIKISQISKDFFKDLHPTSSLSRSRNKEEVERSFFELVKKGFSQKRKMLINNLKADKKVFSFCGIDERARAEDIFLDQWKCLRLKHNYDSILY